ncbi:hypothetical protein V1506DRAFT_559820 [Lipomyces tetrasporus]
MSDDKSAVNLNSLPPRTRRELHYHCLNDELMIVTRKQNLRIAYLRNPNAQSTIDNSIDIVASTEVFPAESASQLLADTSSADNPLNYIRKIATGTCDRVAFGIL